MPISKKFKEKEFEYSFSAVSHKKMPYAIVYIKIDTTENDLLHSLGYKYKKDKLLSVGINANNFMIDCIPGPNGIVIYTPENRITNNIVMFIKFLSTATINSKQMFGTSGSYTKLTNSLKKVNITVTGKCKTFIKNCLQKNSPKMENMMKVISIKEDKKRDDIKNDKFDESIIKKIKLNCNEEQTLDCIISFGTNCLEVKKKGSEYEFSYTESPNYNVYVGSLRGLLKAFRGQSGAIGSPASNDPGQKKYKEKCEEILEAVNTVSYCISDVRGCKCQFKNADSLKQVDSESVKFITQIMKL